MTTIISIVKTILLIFAFLCSNVGAITSEVCPTGMNQKFIDNRNADVYGSAAKIPLSITFYEGSGGAVWYQQQVSIEPRFEIHLKVTINNLSADQSAAYQVVEGFTIMLSTQKGLFRGTNGKNNGYEGLSNMYVTEIDTSNSGGDSGSLYAFHKCFGSATCTTNRETSYTKDFHKTFDPTKEMKYDIRFYYSHQSKQTKVCLENGSYCMTENIDLVEKFGTHLVYIGFSGFQKGNRKELMLLGTFFCQDRAWINNTNATFTYSGVALTEAKVPVSKYSKFQYTIRDINLENVPFNDNLETMSCSIVGSSCSTKPPVPGTISKIERYVEFTCTGISDQYYFNCSIPNKGFKRFNFSVISDTATSYEFYGFDAIAAKSGEVICTNNSCQLKKDGKDFDLSGSPIVNLDFTFKDASGNVVEFSVTDSPSIIQKTGATISAGCYFTMAKNNSNYRMIVNKSTPGQCDISFQGLSGKSYWFEMIVGAPDPSKSTCGVANVSSTPTYKHNETFVYVCRFYDANSNPVNAEKITEYYGITPVFEVKEVLVRNETGGLENISRVDTSESISITYKTKYMGNYVINTYINNTLVSASYGSVNVYGTPQELNTYTKYYYPNTAVWTNATSTNYKANSDGILMYIDPTDLDSQNLLSTFNYHSSFSPSQLSTQLIYPHNPNITLQQPSAAFVTLNNKKVIAVKYSSSTENFIRRTSFPYTLKLTLNSATVNITFNYQTNIGDLITCLDDLDISKTQVTYTKSSYSATGVDESYATLMLKTEDGNFYNYNINITTNSTNNIIKINQGLYEGLYDLNINPTKAEHVYIGLFYNNVSFSTYYIYVEAGPAELINPYGAAYTRDGNTWIKNDSVKASEPEKTYVRVFDKFNNRIRERNPLGMKVTLKRDETVLAEERDITLSDYDSYEEMYYYVDNNIETGTYYLIFKSIDSSNEYTVQYDRIGGDVDPDKILIINTMNSVIYGKAHSFEIEYRDANGMNIGRYESIYQKAVEATRVSAVITGEVSSSFYYENNMQTEDYRVKFSKANLTYIGIATVTVTYNNTKNYTFNYTIGYEKVDIDESVIKARLESDHILSKTVPLVLTVGVDTTPVFLFEFHDEDGNLLTKVNPNSTFTATLKTTDGFSKVLNGSRDGNSYYKWRITEEEFATFAQASYTLEIVVVDSGRTQNATFPVNVVNEGTEDARDDDYWVNKTIILTQTLTLVAGEWKQIVIQFKTRENYRCLRDIDPTIVSFTNEKGYGQSDLNVTFEEGARQGEVIAKIRTFKTGTNKIHFLAKSNFTGQPEDFDASQDLIITVTCAALGELVADPSCIQSGTQLKEGTVDLIPDVLFQPLDIYGNVFTNLYDPTVYSTAMLNALITLTHSVTEGVVIKDATANETLGRLVLTLSTTKTGTITFTSEKFQNPSSYTLVVRSGPMNGTKTVATLVNNSDIVAGQSIVQFKIIPYDQYSNPVDPLQQTEKNNITVSASNGVVTVQALNKDSPVFDSHSFTYNFNLTKVGTYTFTATYKLDTTLCNSCTITVNYGGINLNNIKVFHGDTQFSGQKVTISNAQCPSFTIKFYDGFDNQITSIDQSINAVGMISGHTKQYILDQSKHTDYYTITLDCQNSTKYDDWRYLEAGDYDLLVNLTKSEEKQDKTYDLHILNEAESGYSNKAINPEATEFDPIRKVITAGDHFVVTLRLVTVDSLTYAEWLRNFAQDIIISYSDGYDGCSAQIGFGQKRGYHTVDFTCNKSTIFKQNGKINIKFKINGTDVTHGVELVVNPGDISYETCHKLTDPSSSSEELDDANADNQYSFILKAFDQYDNLCDKLATDITVSIAPPTGINTTFTPTISKNEDYTFTVSLNPIYAGQYTISGRFKTGVSYRFTSMPGDFDVTKSELITNTTCVAGTKAMAIVIPYDQYKNLKTNDENNPYTVYYNHISTTDLTEVTESGKANYTGEDGKTYQVYVFYQNLTKRDENYFTAKIGDASAICKKCMVMVQPASLSFLDCSFLRYQASNNSMVEVQNEYVEDNKFVTPKFQIYPKDGFGNKIDNMTISNDYHLYLTNLNETAPSYQFKVKPNLTNPNAYLEFALNDGAEFEWDDYKTLINGTYQMDWNYGEQNKTYIIYLKGSGNDTEASNAPEDLNKTRIYDQSLTYTAGQSGEFHIQIVTVNNHRKNKHDGYEFDVKSCSYDTNFTFNYEKASTLGVFIVHVSSTVANRYPTAITCRLQILVKSQDHPSWFNVTSLNPQMIVNPDVLHHILINPIHLKSTTALKDATTDAAARCMVSTYDMYNNTNKVSYSQTGIVTNPSSSRGISTYSNGSIFFYFYIYTVGNYKVTSGSGSDGVKYLPRDYDLYVGHGFVKDSKSAIEQERERIEAGRNGTVVVTMKDNHNNIISAYEVRNKLNVSIFDPNSIRIATQEEAVGNNLKFSAYLTKMGTYTWKILNKTTSVAILSTTYTLQVIAAEADVTKTRYYTQDGNIYDEDHPIIIPNTAQTVSFTAKDYDLYDNQITDGGRITITNLFLTGNNMEDILFNAVETTGGTFTISIPTQTQNSTALYTYAHLINGEYQFKMDIDKTNREITATDILNITSCSTLKTALTTSGKYLLRNNYSCSYSYFVVDRKVTSSIDLDGKTLTISSSSTQGFKINGELILKNGTIKSTYNQPALIQLFDGGKYSAYNVNHQGGQTAIGTEASAHAYIEIVGGSFNQSTLFSANGVNSNIIIMKGDVLATSCTNAFASGKDKAELRIYDGNYGFNIESYKRSFQVTLPFQITSTKDYTGYGNGPFIANNTQTSVNAIQFRAGDEDVSFELYFNTSEHKLFNDDVNSTSVVLEPANNTLTATYSKSNRAGISIISLESTKAIDSNDLSITITDKYGGSTVLHVNVSVLPAVLPDPSKTQVIIAPSPTLTPDFPYVSFTIVLYDKYENVFRKMCDVLQTNVWAVKDNLDIKERITPSSCNDLNGQVAFSNYEILYPPANHSLNVMYYGNGVSAEVLTTANQWPVSVDSSIDFSKSQVKCAKCEENEAGQILALTVALYDANNVCYQIGEGADIPLGVRISTNMEGIDDMWFNFAEDFADIDTCKNNFKMIATQNLTRAGSYVIEIFGKVSGRNVTIKTYSHLVVPGPPYQDNFKVQRESSYSTLPIELFVNQIYKFYVQGEDQYHNNVTEIFNDIFDIRIENGTGAEINRSILSKDYSYFKKDAMHYEFGFYTLGEYHIYYMYKQDENTTKKIENITIDGQVISKEGGVSDDLSVVPGGCHEKYNSVDFTDVLSMEELNFPTQFIITCYDEEGNRVNTGGADFTVEITVTQGEDSERNVIVNTIRDLGNGKYNVSFVPVLEGEYTFTIKLNGNTDYNTTIFELKNARICPPEGDQLGLNFQCPGTHECVKETESLTCIKSAADKCEGNTTHPFNCKGRDGGSNRCVKSYADCNCPSGYKHCEDWYQHQCYPENDYWECPVVFTDEDTCKGHYGFEVLCDDGVCRKRADLKPNKYVCPLNYYQCSDLTCVESVDKCIRYDEYKCSAEELQCDDQSCFSVDNAECPSRVTCNNPNDVVCPDNTCAENELFCKPVRCYDPTPVLCPSGFCAINRESCPTSLACGHDASLCEDGTCKSDCRASTQ